MKAHFILGCCIALLSTAASAEETTKTITIPFVKKSIQRNPSFQKRAVASNSIYNYEGTAYLISVNIGTPAQTFDVVLDTGSADFWVPGINCSSISCPSTRFNETNSSTFKSLNSEFNISYAVGYSYGSYATDTVSIGNMSVTNQQLGIAATTDSVIQIASSSSSSGPTYMNGILGLGFPALTYASRQGLGSYNPFVFNLVSQKLIDSPVFSIYLSAKSNPGWTGEITFGGTDASKYQGDLAYLPVAPAATSEQPTTGDYYYWMLYAGGLSVVNSTVEDVTWTPSELSSFILDTGTTLTYLPTSLTKRLFVSLTGTSPLSTEASSGAYVVDCSTTSSAMLQLHLLQSKSSGGNPVVLNVPLSQLIFPLRKADNGTDICIFGIVPSDSTVSGGMYLIGDTILRSFYMVFDMQNERVGLAANVGSGSSVTVNGTSTSTSVPAQTTKAASSASTNNINQGLFTIITLAILITVLN